MGLGALLRRIFGAPKQAPSAAPALVPQPVEAPADAPTTTQEGKPIVNRTGMLVVFRPNAGPRAGEELGAIVVRDWSQGQKDHGAVNLAVFMDGSNDDGAMIDWQTSVPYDQGGAPYSWRFREDVNAATANADHPAAPQPSPDPTTAPQAPQAPAGAPQQPADAQPATDGQPSAPAAADGAQAPQGGGQNGQA